jgi:uncharacterized protein (TIGR02266 family)
MERNKPATAADSVLLVRCESWREFAEHYAQDIGNGGMFVATEHKPAPLSTLEIRVQLPEATEIVLRARVVQVVDAAAAAALSKPAGIGVELLDVDSERKKQIYQLVEFARWQGATNDPQASFARTLLEMSASLPPAEIGHRLSLMPAPSARPSDAANSMRRSQDAGSGRASDSSASHRVAHGVSPSSKAPHERARASARATSTSDTRLKSTHPAAPVPQAPAKPTDAVKLKLLLTEFAHKQYDAALRTTRQMLESNPGDPAALRWQHMCNARLALARSDPQTAATHYEQALQYDDDNREAREFVRTVRRDQKLNSLPFGRYFTKKK